MHPDNYSYPKDCWCGCKETGRLNLTLQPLKTEQNIEPTSPLEKAYVGNLPYVSGYNEYLDDELGPTLNEVLDGEREPDIGGYDE